MPTPKSSLLKAGMAVAAGSILLAGIYRLYGGLFPVPPMVEQALAIAGMKTSLEPALTSTTDKQVQDCAASSPFATLDQNVKCQVTQATAETEAPRRENLYEADARARHAVYDLFHDESSGIDLAHKLIKIPHSNTDDWAAIEIYWSQCTETEKMAVPAPGNPMDQICYGLNKNAQYLASAMASNPAIRTIAQAHLQELLKERATFQRD
jgi:hypothetical protein